MIAVAKKMGGEKEKSVGQACTTHISYSIHNKVMKIDRQKLKDASKCKDCEHMNQGYCNLHQGWCTSIDRGRCQNKNYSYGVIPGLREK